MSSIMDGSIQAPTLIAAEASAGMHRAIESTSVREGVGRSTSFRVMMMWERVSSAVPRMVRRP